MMHSENKSDVNLSINMITALIEWDKDDGLEELAKAHESYLIIAL